MSLGALPGSVSIREVGLRDGLQIEAPVPTAEKLHLLDALVATGVRRVELTSFVSPSAVPALADAEKVAAAVADRPGIDWSALVLSRGGVNRALAAGIRDIEYVVSASDTHSQANAARTTAEALALTGELADLVHEADGRLELIVAMAWDCPFEGPTPPERVHGIVEHAVAAGIDRICLADTIGSTTPVRLTDLVGATRDRAGTLDLGIHLHDTRGMGSANALAAVMAGVTSLDASIGGLGGCPFAPGASGNVATEELAYLLAGCGIETGLDMAALLRAAAVAEAAVGHPLSGSLFRADRQDDAQKPEQRASTR
jgi:hydroxymethylglutaryl-CoA lyase